MKPLRKAWWKFLKEQSYCQALANLWAQLPKRLRQEDHLHLQVQDQPRYHNEMPGQIFNLSYSEMPFLSM